MTWYYAVGSQQQGPVTEEQLQGLIRDGVVTGDTLVWREGMANWQPYRTQVAPGLMPAAAAVEGAATAIAPVTGQALAKDDYDSSFGDCFTRGIAHAIKHLPATYLAVLPVGIVMFAVQTLQAIPFVGWALAMLLGLLLNSALVGGVWRVVLGQSRDEVGGGAFSGFQRGYFQLTLGGIVRPLLAMLSLGPGLVIIGLAVAAGLATSNAMVAGGGVLLGGLTLMAGSLVTFYLLTCWFFMLPLVADKGLGFWEAMQASRQQVRKHWWSNFVLLAALTLIVMIPIMLLSVAFGPTADFKDFKQMVEAAKQGKLVMSPGQVLLTNGLGGLWLWLISPFYFGVVAMRYRDIFGRETFQNR